MKTKFLSTIAFLFLMNLARAQDKYQFMIMEYSTLDNKIALSIDGVEFKKEKIDFSKHKESGYNANPLLEKVNEYQDLGWEVMSFDTEIGGPASQTGSYNSSEIYFVYLRKKK